MIFVRVREKSVGDFSMRTQSAPVLATVRKVLGPLESTGPTCTVALNVVIKFVLFGDYRNEMIIRIRKEGIVIRPLEPVDAVLIGEHVGATVDDVFC